MSDEAAAHSADGTKPEEDGSRVGYADKPGLTGLLVKNFFLTLVTLGFYRFWARARLRRYFWSNILVAGEPLEYTGTGLELFIGFLIALAIVAPLGIIYLIVQRIMLGNPTAAAALGLAYFGVLVIFVQVVIFRARRYRLSRTAWRGIYAAQSGSAWRYLGLSLLYGLLMVLTLGLATPWRSVALERYKIGHSWFGESRFSIDANARDLFPRWLIVMALLVLPVLAIIGTNLTFFPEVMRAQAQAGRLAVKLPHPGALWFLLVSVFAGGPALIWYWIVSFRYIASRTRLGEMRMLSMAKGRSVLRTVLLFLLGSLGFVIILGIGFAVAMFLIGKIVAPLVAANATDVKSMIIAGTIGFVLLVPAYLFALIGFQVISYRWLRVPIIRHLATTLEIENLDAIATIVQSAKPRQKFGIADSFDVGAI